jgi:hypothetical protein
MLPKLIVLWLSCVSYSDSPRGIVFGMKFLTQYLSMYVFLAATYEYLMALSNS